MKRVLALVIVGALCAAAAGCNVSPPPATVDGVAISRSELQAQLTQATGPIVQCALTVQEAAAGRTLPAVTGSGDSTVTTTFTAFVLDRLIQQILEQRALEARHAAVSAGDESAARQDYESQLVSAESQVGSPCNLTGAQIVAQLPSSFLDAQARLVADQEKLESVAGHVDVSTAALRAYYASHITAVTELCVNLIVANDQASAQAIHDQIAAGTSFATAAQGSGASAETPAQGQGPCLEPASLQQELGQANAQAIEALADGQVAPPEDVALADPTTGAPTQTWIVFGVRQHELIPFDDAESGLRQQLLDAAGPRLTAALNGAARGASIELDPRYGTWSLSHGVSVPTAPPSAFVLNPGAGQSTAGAAVSGATAGAPSP